MPRHSSPVNPGLSPRPRLKQWIQKKESSSPSLQPWLAGRQCAPTDRDRQRRALNLPEVVLHGTYNKYQQPFKRLESNLGFVHIVCPAPEQVLAWPEKRTWKDGPQARHQKASKPAQEWFCKGATRFHQTINQSDHVCTCRFVASS